MEFIVVLTHKESISADYRVEKGIATAGNEKAVFSSLFKKGS
jgi:hypothetical protein